MAIVESIIKFGVDVATTIINKNKPSVVTIIVCNENKKPVHGVVVMLSDASKETTVNRSKETTVSGKAIFPDMAAGLYSASIKHEGKEKFRDEFYLNPGVEVTIPLTLPDIFEPAPTSEPAGEKGTTTPIPIIEEPPPQPEVIKITTIAFKCDPFETFIKQLTQCVRVNSNGEIDMTDSQKAKDIILSSPENLGAAFLAAQSLDGIKQDLLKKFRADLENKLKTRSFHLVWDENLATAKRESSFDIVFYEQQNRCISFEFWRAGFNDFVWGIRKKDSKVVVTRDMIGEICAIMTNSFGRANAHKSDEYWPWCAWADGAEFVSGFKDWSKSPAPWQAIQDGTLADRIVGIADKVHAAFKDRMELLLPMKKRDDEHED
jgi:hypothetical protein